MAKRYAKNMPHPALTPVSLDYRPEFRFAADLPYGIRKASGGINIILDYTLTAPSLRSLISDGEACFSVVASSPATRTRLAYSTAKFRHPITLDSDRFKDRCSITPYIIAAETLDSYKSPDWAQEIADILSDGTFLPRGSILGRANAIEWDDDDLSAVESIFEMAPSRQIDSGRYTLDLEGDRIVIQVSHDDLPIINGARSKSEGQDASLWGGMYQRALEEGIRKHLSEDNRAKRWARVIAQSLATNDIETDDTEILDAQSLQFAQILLQDPLTKFLTAVVTESEEDD